MKTSILIQSWYVVDALKVNQSNLTNTLSKHQLLKVVQLATYLQLSINVLNVEEKMK